jgi:hypothetical protein
MADERQSSPTEEVQRLYDEAEAHTARAFEEVVSRGSFGELLARITENVVGMARISTDVFDLMLRNLRLAGRQDVTRLAQQIGRNEDMLELLLQQIERLEEELRDAREQPDGSRAGTRRGGRTRRTGSPNGGPRNEGRGRAGTRAQEQQ